MEPEIVTASPEKGAQFLIMEGLPMAKKGEVRIEKLKINTIKLNRNSRLNIKPEELDGLMQSIKEEGLLQPIGVVQMGPKNYEICYGNRRFLACAKLGLTTIPAIVHTKQKESDVDIKNLTENVQRRNISLMEVGRYIQLLEKQGLSKKETAVRLGVHSQYVEQALTAFHEVPDEFKKDIEVRVAATNTPKGSRTTPGKISVMVAKKIISAQKSGKITRPQVKKLFKAAKESSRFNPAQVDNYIQAVASGEKKFLSNTKEWGFITTTMKLDQAVKEKFEKQFINDGPYKNWTQLLAAVIRGEKAVRIPVEGGRR